jgi:hypothetical protein
MKAERFVLDSNVLISAALCSTGTPSALLDVLGDVRAVLLFSEETHIELCHRIMKKKFDRYVSSLVRQQFLSQLDAVSEFIPIVNRHMGCRDPEDNKFLETAVNGNADCLITGDKDLLTLHPFQGIPVLPPAEALTRIHAILE